ncbi:MAG: terminase family protein [Burkholderiales bacterium]|jgi:phage terminase large subunit-like protein
MAIAVDLLEEVRALDPIARERLLRRWDVWGRPEQQPPPGEWRTWLILAGRGWGKSRTGAEWVRAMATRGRARRIALVARTAADVRDVLIEGESGLLAIHRADERPVWEPSRRRLTWPNGAIATTYSADEPDQLRGPQHDSAWVDEICAWRYPDAWDQLQLGLRLGDDPRVVATTTPRPTALVRSLVAAPSTVVTRGRTADNARNLAPGVVEALSARYAGTRLGRQELDGEVLDDTPGALWARAMIESASARVAPELRRVVVALDPSVAADGGGDECGIVVAGIDYEGRAWVLRDGSGNLSPADWSRRAVALAEEHAADCIVAEANQGGALVEQTLRAAGARTRVRLVHAARGKRARAEPVAALYEQGRVRHLPGLQRLEDEMCTWSSAAGDPSPNRLDALVWACFDLCGLAAAPRVASETGYDF